MGCRGPLNCANHLMLPMLCISRKLGSVYQKLQACTLFYFSANSVRFFKAVDQFTLKIISHMFTIVLGPKQSCLVNDSDSGLEVGSWHANLDAEDLGMHRPGFWFKCWWSFFPMQLHACGPGKPSRTVQTLERQQTQERSRNDSESWLRSAQLQPLRPPWEVNQKTEDISLSLPLYN